MLVTTIDLNDLKREPVEVETAFLVIFRGTGMIQAVPDINVPVLPRRTVTMDEIEIAALKIASDIQADKTAQVLHAQMGQAARAMQQQVEAAQIAQKLKL